MSSSSPTPSAPRPKVPWQPLAKRKQSYRAAKLPTAWLLPSTSPLLPQDPSVLSPTTNPAQPVLHVPAASGLLTPSEISITESHSVASLLSAISSRKLTTVEVATSFCKRACLAQQLTNCITEPLFDEALERAAFLDGYIAKHGEPFGPLHGLPVSVKDTFNIKGIDTSIGLVSLCFKPATQNAPLVDLLLSLGCVIIAKTNIPQTLGSLDSNNNVFGRTMNPVNRLVTAGGSSGGEGVMVAMRGCMVGWGTDIGGSIRVPAMCNGVFGFKPANGRLPYGGQALTSGEGMYRVGITAVAGPLAKSVEDLDIVLRETVPRARLWGEDCMPGSCPERWEGRGSGEQGEFVFGVLRSDGNCEPLPPIHKVLDEVKRALGKSVNVKVVELASPPAWKKCQGVMQKVMSLDAGNYMSDLLEAGNEPLVPWMQTRFRRGKPRTLQQAAGAQQQRTELEQEMLKIWYEHDEHGRRRPKLDAIICGMAPHPVPEIDKYNAVGFTSSFVLLDYPAGTVPVRAVGEDDLELGKPQGGSSLGSWDDKNRELWDETKMDRRVYLGTPLCVQVVTPRLEDRRLLEAMRIVSDAVRGSAVKARL